MEEITFSKRARLVGGNLVVTIPKEIVQELDLKEKEMVEMCLRKRSKPSLFGDKNDTRKRNIH